MTTTDRVILATATAKSRYTCVGAKAGPVEKAIIKPISNLNKPNTNRTQAAMVARLLNLDGIITPPSTTLSDQDSSDTLESELGNSNKKSNKNPNACSSFSNIQQSPWLTPNVVT
jgi:hypothetical protein